ncbi:MAG: GntR family transcriptional regulator [Paenibacillus sp.]|nr:GntR family transcriptional regulator [Paenibacillus sp.]
MTRPSLRETAYETILGWIGSGRMPEGAVTSENALAEQLDMSRTPIRAALQQLETEGFLRIVPKHGVLILHASAQRVGDLLETLTALLLFAYEQHKHTKIVEIAAAATELADRIAEASDRESPESLARIEGSLWMRVLSLGRNQELIRLGHKTMDKLQWSINDRRWRPPYRPETEQLLLKLLSSMIGAAGPGPDFFSYLHLLKRTWS